MLYPRHLRLGLIDARLSRRIPECLTDIRGIYASASLKRVSGRGDAARVPEYPRHLRLGLIEASREIIYLSPMKSYPRHLRLGLIEAQESL